jgi:DNA polymerase-4
LFRISIFGFRALDFAAAEEQAMARLSVPPREILHLDADAFFASVEQRDDPRLRYRPVAVGTGVVASCSYEARRYGVRTAMRLTEARQLCRPLIVVPGAYPRYEQVGRQLLALCRERTPLVETAALDDLYLDLTPTGLEQGEKVARTIREQVLDEIRINVSIGIGRNKLVANVATKEVKRLKEDTETRGHGDKETRGHGDTETRGHGDTETVKLSVAPCPLVSLSPCLFFRRVPFGEERAYLAPWPVRVLPGAGGKIQARLDRLNVQRVGEVAEMPVDLLRQLFGLMGPRLSEYSHGIDHRPVTPDRWPQSISRRTSFDPPTGDLNFLRAMLGYLVERAASWLRFQNLTARGLALTLTYGDYETVGGQERLSQPTQRDDLLREAAVERFLRLYTRRLPLRLVGVELTPVVPCERQTSLLDDEEHSRQHRLDACKDAIRQRFGFTSLLSADALLLTATLPHDRRNFTFRTPCLTR